MAEARCPHCGCIAYPGEATCDECGNALRAAKATAPANRSGWRLLWPLSLLAIGLFPERALALLMIPGVAAFMAAAILVIGLPSARQSRRPRLSCIGVVATALVPVCFWLRPAFLLPWIPSMLPLVLLVIVAFILPEAATFRDPNSFRIGIIMMAAPVASLWRLHAWIARLDLGFREYNVVLHGLALLAAVGLFMGGVQFLWWARGSDSQ